MGNNNSYRFLPPETARFYSGALQELHSCGIPFLVGGAYAFRCYTGIERHTKDFDVFLRREHLDGALECMQRLGCHTDRTFPHWLAKAFSGDDFVDLIYSSGNGIVAVDDEWFQYAVPHKVFDIDVGLCPAEEIIWSKAFVQERERFDGADIVHIIRARAGQMNWDRLLRRFAANWRILLEHLVLFGFVYPGERTKIPAGILRELIDRLTEELGTNGAATLCNGTLISREQYLPDIERWGYRDARLSPESNMSRQDIAHWTAAIDNEGKHG